MAPRRSGTSYRQLISLLRRGGRLSGYFAKSLSMPLVLTPVSQPSSPVAAVRVRYFDGSAPAGHTTRRRSRSYPANSFRRGASHSGAVRCSDRAVRAKALFNQVIRKQLRFSILVVILAVLPTFGCGRQPRAVAADGAAPGVAVDIPVGPIPGLSQQPALMTNPYVGNPSRDCDVRISDDRAPRKHRNDHGHHSHSQEKDDIHPGMTEKPEELLPEQRTAAVQTTEEVESPLPLEFEKYASHGQRRQRNQDGDRDRQRAV